MRKLIAGNWKMHGNRALARELAQAAKAASKDARCDIALCPPAVLLAEIAPLLAGSAVKLGGQDCHARIEGAYTGDTSAAMLKEAGCAYVIVGHSERRAAYNESSEAVRAKAEAVIKQGLIPIICIGEPLEIREQGQAEAYVGAQARASVPEGLSATQFVLAYEPVWAIGTGKTPTADDIRRMHTHLKEIFPGAAVLYGGSVKASNAAEIMALPEVDGALVGGASLKVDEFNGIIAAVG